MRSLFMDSYTLQLHESATQTIYVFRSRTNGPRQLTYYTKKFFDCFLNDENHKQNKKLQLNIPTAAGPI